MSRNLEMSNFTEYCSGTRANDFFMNMMVEEVQDSWMTEDRLSTMWRMGNLLIKEFIIIPWILFVFIIFTISCGMVLDIQVHLEVYIELRE